MDREEIRTMRIAICIQEQIYDALKDLLGNLRELPDNCKMMSFGFMNLNLDMLKQRNTTTTIALSHYYKHPSGDMIPDPDVEIRIFHELQMAEALSFQDIFGYKQVYHENGYIDAEAKTMLNKFLLQWLRNLKAQGFRR